MAAWLQSGRSPRHSVSEHEALPSAAHLRSARFLLCIPAAAITKAIKWQSKLFAVYGGGEWGARETPGAKKAGGGGGSRRVINTLLLTEELQLPCREVEVSQHGG